jgi:hypothetical protein
MKKTTLQFSSLIDMARFSKVVATGYLMNTNNYTLTGKFTEEDIAIAVSNYQALVIETTEKVFSY